MKKKQKEQQTVTIMIIAAVLLAGFILFNQLQIISVAGAVPATVGNTAFVAGEKDLSNINLDELQSTAHTLAAVFPLENVQTADDAMAVMFPTGTPSYGEGLGVSYDDPIGSLDILDKMYRGLRVEIMENNPEGWERFMSLASKPVGISCEFCCGLKAIGIDKEGNSMCGCQHNPALLSVALSLAAYSDYSDGEILREVMRWKTLFFPKDMISIGMSVAGKDASAIADLPGMVGGC